MNALTVLREERTLAVVVLASGIFIGLGVPSIADALHSWALPALFFVSVFSLIPFADLPRATLFSVNADVVRSVLWQQVVLPCIVIAAGVVARFPDSIIVLMIVTACSGSLFSSPALAEILGLDQRRALQVMVLSTLFMPVSLFSFLTLFHGTQANLDIAAYALRTMVYLALPFVLLLLVGSRPIISRVTPTMGKKIAVISRWATISALLVFGTGLMSPVSDKLDGDAPKVFFLLALATTLCLSMMVLTTIVMYRFGHKEAMTASVVSGFRNIGLGFALVGEMVGPDLGVYAGISLLPVFVAPLVLRLGMLASGGAGGGEAAQELEPREIGSAGEVVKPA